MDFYKNDASQDTTWHEPNTPSKTNCVSNLIEICLVNRRDLYPNSRYSLVITKEIQQKVYLVYQIFFCPYKTLTHQMLPN